MRLRRKAQAGWAALMCLVLAELRNGQPREHRRGLKDGSIPKPEYIPWILKAGAICPQIPPAIIAAQIEAESSWNPKAVSPANAKGLSQFIPDTWASYGVDGDGDGVADPFDPYDAIMSQGTYDCAIAKELLPDVSSGNVKGDIVAVTLVSYNAGPFRVTQFHGIPPYEETQDYVASILKSAAKYQGSLNSGGNVPSDGSTGARIVAAARSVLGMPYIWGGGGSEGPTGGGFDCSGLTQFAVFQGTGGKVEIPRTSQTQRGAGTSIPSTPEAMQPGDIIVINNDGDWGHVGLYIGNGQMIHAPRPGKTVEITDLDPYWLQFPWDVRRMA
ncbi:transglycosylase TgdA [Streptomyces olivoverticillatus]